MHRPLFLSSLTRLTRWVVYAVCAFLLASSLCAVITEDPLDKVLVWPVSPVLLDSRGELIHARLSSAEEWCLPVPLEDMGEWLPKVLIAVEDKRFYQHRGVDDLSLLRAIFYNCLKGRIVSGASTITSQLIRISDPQPRTFKTKVQEFISAWKLERRLTKTQILELYLNRAPFGGPIRGVEAASRLYFGKRAKDLSLGEAALLVGLLKGPTYYRPDRNPKRALERRNHIIHMVASEKNIAPEMVSLALKEPLPVFRTRMPQVAWHFADLAFATAFGEGYAQTGSPYFQRKRTSSGGADQGEHEKAREGQGFMGRLYSSGIVQGTLDMRLQLMLQRTLEQSLSGNNSEVTAAGIIVDNSSSKIVAYVGNARFNPVSGKAWVDCGVAPRSPGSTLKPFIYLRAFEMGKIIPQSLLADTPLEMKGNAPRNFDAMYRGPVAASYALANSLNVPAVRVQRLLGVGETLRVLRKAGFGQLKDDNTYGDSLVLGAGEVTLVELARAYTTIANQGYDRPLALALPYKQSVLARAESVQTLLLREIPSLASSRSATNSGLFSGYTAYGFSSVNEAPYPSRGKQLYTRSASFLIADILKDPGRLPFVVQLTQAREESPIAFKTGTSYGLRDAWTAAYFPAYTIVVWFGREDGGADLKLVGLSQAAPAAMQVARQLALESPPRQRWYEPPVGGALQDRLEKRAVCALSGETPSAFCPSIIDAWVIPSVFRTIPCKMHALRNGRVSVLWPPELEDYKTMRIAEKDMSRPISIISPVRNTEYLIPPGMNIKAIPLKAEGITYPAHWYDGSEYLGVQESSEVPLYWEPQAGNHTLSVLDANGKTSSVQVTIIDLAKKIQQNRADDLFKTF